VIVLEGDPLERQLALERNGGCRIQIRPDAGITVNLRAEDIFRSSNSRPSWWTIQQSVLYVPGMRPDPSTNVLDLRGIVHWPDL